MNIDLNNKAVIVTGASGGIGRELALAFAREGAKTAAIDYDAEGLSALENTFAKEGLEGLFLECDVRDEAQTQSVVDRTAERFGHLDVLVNNAGVCVGGAVETMTAEQWDLNFDVNAKGVFLMSKAAIPHMKRQRAGRIINAASFAAIIPSLDTAAYAASKAAVHYFTRVLAGELGPWNITVNCYAPGMVPSGMNNFDKLTEAEASKLLDTLTLRRWQTPQDVFNLVSFLASDLSAYITGAILDVSGGKLATQRPYAAYSKANREG